MIKSIKSLWFLMPHDHRRRGIFLVFLLLIGAALELASVGTLLPAIKLMQDRASLESTKWFQNVSDILNLPTNDALYIWIVSFVGVIFLIKSISLLLINKYQFNYFAKVQAEFSRRLFSKYLFSDYAFFIEANSSVLVRSVTKDIENVVVLIIFSSVTILTEFIVAVPLFLFIVWLNPLVAGIALVAGGFCFYLISTFVSKHLRPIGEELQVDMSKLIQNVQEGVGGIKELKILARERFYQHTFDRRATSYAFGLGRYLFLNTIPRLLLESMFVLIFIGALLIFSFEGNLYGALPMLAVYAATSFRLIPGLNRAAGAFNSINLGQASLNTLVEGLADATDSNKDSREVASTRCGSFESLTMNSVSFDFSNGKQAIRNVSLEIKAGEIVGIVGSSGAGKTTLMDLLLGLLGPKSGQILVNGDDIHDDIKRWQALIGYVTQNIFLIDGSIRSNIAFGVPSKEVDDSNVWKSLKRANLADFVKSIPDGLNTQVGERGVKFSGGQRQRIGIARALYRDPPVLVLDEATSALDGETEQEVIKEIALFKGKKTIIIIAHRVSSLSACDRIFEIQNGKLKSIKSYAEIT